MSAWLGLLEASVVGGICIVLFFAVSQFLGVRYRSGYKKVVWLLIALRMCIPVSTSFFPKPFTVQVPLYVLRESGAEAGAAYGSEAAVKPAREAPAGIEGFDGGPDGSADGIMGSGGQFTSWHVLGIVWTMGTAAVLIYYLSAHFFFFRRMMKKSRECTDKRILAESMKIARRMGIKELPQVRLFSDVQTGPFTTGVFRNIIFLPEKEYQERDLQYILRHELAHCAGRDTQIKLLFIIVNAIHWFNPLAWFMKALVNQDLELACDEKVLAETSGRERGEYSELLMSCIERGRVGGAALSTGYIQGVRFIKRRFGNIFNMQKKSGRAAVCVMTVLLALVSAGIGFQAGRTVYARSGDAIEEGADLQVDVTGDGRVDRVRVFDNNDALRTSVGLTDASGAEAWFEYEDDVWAASWLTAGDLNGNGAADIVLMRYSNGMHGTGFFSVLYVEGEPGSFQWLEYPEVFISNPNIDREQPETFSDIECRGATVIEKDGRHYLHLTAMDMDYFGETGGADDSRNLYIDCSWQKDGWFIEEIRVMTGDGEEVQE